MLWKTKRIYGKRLHYSIKNKLKKEGKYNDNLEIMITMLTLEELIALKLELSTKIVNSKLYGIPIWKNLYRISKAAALKYALSCARTKTEAALFLGMNYKTLEERIKRYEIDLFF